jgi:hypothetical protein
LASAPGIGTFCNLRGAMFIRHRQKLSGVAPDGFLFDDRCWFAPA